jgi:carboxyl-terminal processing protease
MFQKGKAVIFLFSAVIILYGASAVFFGNVIAGRDKTYPAIEVFMDALGYVNKDYVEAPDMNKVQQGAMRGLMEALDPYSTFLSKEKVQVLDSRKEFAAGVGMVLSKRANIIYVVATERGGPAESAGVRPGDYLTAIDGANVEDSSLLEADSILRGAPGTSVKVSVFRGAQTKPIDIQIVRKISEPLVAARMVDEKIAVVEISSLNAAAIEQVRLKLKTLVSAGAQKLVLDLRDCAGGGANEGADLANFFLKTGTICTSKARTGEIIQEIKAAADKCLTDLPMVVLENGSTAGAAEIVAGALKANGRAAVIGERSFGMGSIQKRIALKSGAVLILSTAKFYTPDGKMIENDVTLRDAGIKPDVESPDAQKLQDLLVDSYFDGQEDTAKYKQLQAKVRQEQFDKAVEVLKKGVQAAKKIQ